ncbi:MAG: winged helix-turn-helix transcriptional regulator [Euryarchaeota archaeon]|nr:winged helix-turn-helix transcriptional regulator [Euryarchaeota archaeon]
MKGLSIAFGLLVIVSLGAPVLAGGGPNAEETAKQTHDEVERRIADLERSLERRAPAMDGGSGPATPSDPMPANPLPSGGGSDPTDPKNDPAPEEDPPAPEAPERPEPEVPETPTVTPADIEDEARAAPGKATGILTPITDTADAIGDAAAWLISGGLDSGQRVIALVGGASDRIGGQTTTTVNGVLALLLHGTGDDDGAGSGSDGFGLTTASTSTGLVQDANRVSAVALFAVGSMGVALFGFAVLRRLIGLGGIALLSRIPSKDIMKNETRAGVFEIVENDPGVSLNEIVDRLGISRNAVAYHLAVFEQEKSIVSIKDGKYRRYFINGGKFANGAKVVVSAIRNDITRNVARYILTNPGVIQKDVCSAVGTSPSATNWHIGRLEKVGLVEKQKVANTVQYQPGPSLTKYDLSDFGLEAPAIASA